MILADLNLDEIQPHDANVRRNLGDLTELAASIAGQGVLQPLVVARADGTHILIAGHRRLAAAKQAGLANVPCVIRTDLDTRAAQLQAMLTENLQRTDLTVMEEAVAYEQLQLLGVKPAAIAKTTGRAKKTVDSRLRLMGLPEKTRDAVDMGQVTLADAEWLTKYTDDQELMELAAAAHDGRDARWRVESRLRRREWEKEAAERAKAEPVKPSKAEQQRDREREESHRLRQELLDQRAVSVTMRRDWIREQIANESEEFWNGLAILAAVQVIEGWGGEGPGEAMGLPEAGPDDDVDDHLLRTVATVKAWPPGKALRLLALASTEILNPPTWQGVTESITQLADFCGYPVTDGERELMEMEASQ